jgi:hypothetical protein
MQRVLSIVSTIAWWALPLPLIYTVLSGMEPFTVILKYYAALGTLLALWSLRTGSTTRAPAGNLAATIS